MGEISAEQKPNPKKKKHAKKLNGHRPPIVADAIYPRPDAAIVADCAVITVVRAYLAGHLNGYRIGRHVKHSGRQLLDWLEAGGKTGNGSSQEAA